MKISYSSDVSFSKWVMLTLFSVFMLSGCGDDDKEGTDEIVYVLPDGLTLAFLNATDASYIAYNTTSESSADLNDLADTSGDSAVQKMKIDDVADIGFFYHWPDFRIVDDEETTDMKYLLMKPGYLYQSGATIDSDQFVQLVHFHGEDLAAHSADEFDDPEAGSNKEAGLIRLNQAVSDQEELENEVAEVLEDGQILCRAFIDPFMQFELEHEAEEEEGEEEHDHGALMHFALTESGRVYFYQEGESEELESSQGFVTLDGISSITDCGRTTMARASDDGILIFVADANSLYLVDNHGADYHQHSVWDLDEVLPEGFHADLMAVIGEGSEHEHEDE